MARISKDPEIRRDEIIQAAQELFIEKGVAATKISDVVKRVGVSQGVFYYYFSSKEEIVDAIVDRYIRRILSGAATISNSAGSILERLEKIAEQELAVSLAQNNHIHAIKGVGIHERIIRRLVIDLVPLMAACFEKPEEVLLPLESFIASSHLLLDPGLFPRQKEERNARIDYILGQMEAVLGFSPGDLGFYRKLMRYDFSL